MDGYRNNESFESPVTLQRLAQEPSVASGGLSIDCHIGGHEGGTSFLRGSLEGRQEGRHQLAAGQFGFGRISATLSLRVTRKVFRTGQHASLQCITVILSLSPEISLISSYNCFG